MNDHPWLRRNMSETKRRNMEKAIKDYPHIQPPDHIEEYIIVPGDKTDWAFYGAWERIKQAFRLVWNQSKRFSDKSYWTKVNTIEAMSFATKVCIIFPGLLFGKQWWWLYIFALVSSLSLIATSTVKTLPTIICFNICWSILATAAILKHFL